VEKIIEKNRPFSKEPSFENGFFSSQGTYIHPSSVIGNNVQLGLNVKIGPFCTLGGKTFIDSSTRLYGYVSVGMPAQDTGTPEPIGVVEIGKNCDIREFVTISSPKIADNKTKIGNDCYIMNFSHIAHDVIIEDNVTLINSVNLAGHVYIEHHAILMANTGIHQFCRVGAYSALAPFSGMRQDLAPFCLFTGTPGRFSGLNVVALKRDGISSQEIAALKQITKLFFVVKLPLAEIVQEAAQVESLRSSKLVEYFLTFAQNSSRGITRKTTRD